VISSAAPITRREPAGRRHPIIRLCGFPLSNYYSKVKFVLLEHEIPFEEVPVSPGQDEVADAAGYVSLPPVGMTTQIIYERDFLLDAGIDWKGRMKAVGERPAAQRVTEDRKRYVEAQKARKAQEA